jgi:hypothetical protein
MTYAIPPTTSLSQWTNDNDVIYQLRKEAQDPAISMMVGGADEMIRVTRDGFWVRGVRVPQDEQEAETVYNAFKQWMAWAALQQRR